LNTLIGLFARDLTDEHGLRSLRDCPTGPVWLVINMIPGLQ
jgi:hypothetical protein